MKRFDHEKLDVYEAALEWVVLADDVVAHLPRGRGYLADQLHRAATSILLNIGEGAGEFSRTEKARFYRIAKRSAMECAAIIHMSLRLGLIDDDTCEESHKLLDRVSAMLTKMARRRTEPAAGAGAGTGLAT
jgi:four helix bundle protein